MNIHVVSGIRTHEPSNRAAAHMQLRWHGHRDWHCTYLCSLIVLVNRKKNYGSLLTIIVDQCQLQSVNAISVNSGGIRGKANNQSSHKITRVFR
jgi:hypothetical protein